MYRQYYLNFSSSDNCVVKQNSSHSEDVGAHYIVKGDLIRVAFSVNYCNLKTKCGNMDVPHGSQNHLAKCEMCDKSYDQQSLTSCPECELIYCMLCCQDIHSKGKLTCHTIFLYMCNICNELSGGYDCFDCGLSFCEACSTKRHSRGAFTRHTLAVRQSHLAVNVYKTSMSSIETPCSTNNNNNNTPVTAVASLKASSMHNFTHNLETEDYLPITKKQRLFDPNTNDYNSVMNSPCSKSFETWTLLNSNGIMSPGPSSIVQHGNSIINNYMPPINGQMRNQQLLSAMSVPASMLHQSTHLEEQQQALQENIASSHALSALVNEFEPVDHVGESHCELTNDGFGIPSPANTSASINPALLMLHMNSNFPSVSPKKCEIAHDEKELTSADFKTETLGSADASCFITNISHDTAGSKKPSLGSPIRSPTSTTAGIGREADIGKLPNGRKGMLTDFVAEKFDLSFLNEKPKKKRRIFNPDEKSRLTNFAESLNWTWQAREVEEFARDNDFTVQQVKDFIYNRKRNMKHSIPDLTKSQTKNEIHSLSMGMSPPHCAIDQALESITQCSYLSSPDSNNEPLPMSDCVFLLDASITEH